MQAIIWNRTMWDARSPNGRYYSGVAPHYDHAHIELTRHAAAYLNVPTIRAVMGGRMEVVEARPLPPPPKPKPLTMTELDVEYLQSDPAHGGDDGIFAIGPHHWQRLTGEEWGRRSREPGAQLKRVHPLVIIDRTLTRTPVPVTVEYLRTPAHLGGKGEVIAFSATHWDHLDREQWADRQREGARATDVHPLVAIQKQRSRKRV